MRCTRCGALKREAARFCFLCGQDLLVVPPGTPRRPSGPTVLCEVPSFCGELRGVVFSQSGNHLLVSGELGVALWDLRKAAEVRRIALPEGSLLTADLSPDGRHALISRFMDGVFLYDLTCGKLVRTFGKRGFFDVAARCTAGIFCPSGTHVLTRGDGLTLWDADTGRRKYDLSNEHVSGIWFTPNGDLILGVADRWVAAWETRTGHKLGVFEFEKRPLRIQKMNCDSRRMVVFSEDTVTESNEAYVVCLPDLRCEARVRLTDVADVSADGSRLICCEGGRAIVRTTSDRSFVAGLDHGRARSTATNTENSHGPHFACFSNTGRFAVTIDEDVCDVVLWNASTGGFLGRWNFKTCADAWFSDNDERMFTGSVSTGVVLDLIDADGFS